MMQTGNTLALAVTLCILIDYVNAISVSPRTIQTREGHNTMVNCSVDSSNNFTVFWSKNDTRNSFTQIGKLLKLENIKPEDAGYYICYSMDTSLPGNNGTVGNLTVDAVNIVVQENSTNGPASEKSTNGKASDTFGEENEDDKEEEQKEDDDDDDYFKTQFTVVVTLISVGTVGVIIFIIYLMKYRLPRRMVYWLRHFQSNKVSNEQTSPE